VKYYRWLKCSYHTKVMVLVSRTVASTKTLGFLMRCNYLMHCFCCGNSLLALAEYHRRCPDLCLSDGRVFETVHRKTGVVMPSARAGRARRSVRAEGVDVFILVHDNTSTSTGHVQSANVTYYAGKMCYVLF
jgi:hypothetical protein